jgi:aspartate/methionine/tyrosine aminotransferase
MADRALVLNGVAKTYSMTGWRVGWMIGPQDVIKAASSYQTHLCGNVANVAQRAALAAVAGPLDVVHGMRAAFDVRRKRIVSMLSEIPGVQCPTPKGAFYAYPSLKAVLGKEIHGERPSDTLELADLILREAEVAVVPGEAFGTPGYFRFSYALAESDLVEGVRRVGDLLAEAK